MRVREFVRQREKENEKKKERVGEWDRENKKR